MEGPKMLEQPVGALPEDTHHWRDPTLAMHI